MHTILVPIAGSMHSIKALSIACDLASKYRGQIALLHVLAKDRSASDLLSFVDPTIVGPKLTSALQAAAKKGSNTVPEHLLREIGEKVIDHAAERVQGRNLSAMKMKIEIGDPAEIILNMHKRVAATTIVMGCRGANGSTASSFGSVSNAIFQKADCTCVAVK